MGAQCDRAGNRQLFFDHYCAYILLFLFNPISEGAPSIAANLLDVPAEVIGFIF